MLRAMLELGPLLASGRDADIFGYGPDLVLRRSRRGRSMEREAKVMQYVAAHDFPAPRVEDVRAGGSELIMERIEGPTMLDVLSRRPWTLGRNAARLARLHHRLHGIAAPDWLDRFLGGDACVAHLDLHPLNVVLSPKGPVLLDWTNARAGTAEADVALTWLVLAAAELGDTGTRGVVSRVLRAAFLRAFLRHFELAGIRDALPAVTAWKCEDRNMRPPEIAAMRRLAASAARPSLSSEC
jgi:aminoglycoside phosphotransferase (APT) family kinase protein